MLSAALILTSSIICQAQDSKNPSEGFACADVRNKLEVNSEVKDNRMLVSQCCGGVKLFAKVRVEKKTNKRTIIGWHAEDSQRNSLEIVEQQRSRITPIKARQKERITDTLLLIKSHNACFIIAQKREIIN